MRLSTDADRDEQRALGTIAAAFEAGITVFDTARAYGHGEGDLGHNERLLARALRRCGAESTARIVTKGGMRRAGGRWVPDGRAKTILSDCETSLEALDGLPIDVYLLHAPDQRTSWRTSLRALMRLVDEGMVRCVGVSNVNRRQLDEAIELAPVSAVQVALSVYDDRALRGGLVERCEQAGIALMAHSPLGGPRRAGRLGDLEGLSGIAEARDVTAADVALAWLLDLSRVVVPIPGARRPETARSAARAATLRLEEEDRPALLGAFGSFRPSRVERSRRDGAEVVIIMGIPGAGKSRLADRFIARGYLRLNRDERGGSLRELADVLDKTLEAEQRSVVLDNTYLTRAARSHVLEIAHRHALIARCIWLDTPGPRAEVNIVERLLDRLGSLPTPEELKVLAKVEGVISPTSLMRTVRELEPPSSDEGWDDLERVSFVREPQGHERQPGVFVAAAALSHPGFITALAESNPKAPHLVYGWAPDGSVASLQPAVDQVAAAVSGPVESALCPHPAGPPRCWCRPPLPGLPLAFARAQRVDPSRSTLVGSRPTDRTLAEALGAEYIHV